MIVPVLTPTPVRMRPDGRAVSACEALLRRRWLLVALLLVMAAGAVLQVEGKLVDLGVYRFGGSSMVHGLPLYTRTTGPDLLFTYPPFAALLMVPVALLPAQVAAGLWTAAGALALGATLRLFLAQRPPLQLPPWLADRVPAAALVPLLVAASLPLEPVLADFRAGQINLFLMLMVTVDLLAPDRRRAGILLGIAAGIKLTPLVFVVLLVLVGRRSTALRASAAFVATAVVGLVLAPGSSAAYWGRAVWQSQRVGDVEYTGNQSIQGTLDRLIGHQPSAALWLAVAGPLVLATLLVAAAWWRRGARDVGTCLGAIAMLLASPISWNHHWVWAAPITLLGLRLASRWLVLGWVAVFVSHAPFWPPHHLHLERGWSAADQVVGNSYVWLGLLLVAYAAWRLRRPPAVTQV